METPREPAEPSKDDNRPMNNGDSENPASSSSVALQPADVEKASDPPGTSSADPFAVSWTEPADQDPENPLSWTASRKWSIIGTLSFLTFLTPLASSMFAPGVPEMMAEFHTSSDTVATFVVSIFVLGFAMGPLVIAPMSELYGRLYVYHVCNVAFVVFSAGCALATNVGMLLAFRFLAGFAGVAVVTCGSGSIVDMMPPAQRGTAMALWSLGPLLGPVVGPVCAGFLVEAKGWRWVFWIITILSGVATAASFFVLRETYAPVLLKRRAVRLRTAKSDHRYYSALDNKDTTPRQLFLAAIVRPARMFVFSPVVLVTCVYIAMIYGFLYILFTTFTFVYHDIYGFGSVGAGLSFIAGGVGNIFGLLFAGVLSDRIVKRGESVSVGDTGSRDGSRVGSRVYSGVDSRVDSPVRSDSSPGSAPEDRLHLSLVIPSTITLPAGLLMYGWTADKHLHWILPMIGTAVMGFGCMGVLMSAQTYLVDAYPRYAASATAALAVLRSLLGALLPLCGLQLYDRLGLGWGNTLLGLLCLALAPVPCILNVYGGRIRASPRFRKDF